MKCFEMILFAACPFLYAFPCSYIIHFCFFFSSSDILYIQNFLRICQVYIFKIFSEFVRYVQQPHYFPAILGSISQSIFKYQWALPMHISDGHVYACLRRSCLCILPLVLVYRPRPFRAVKTTTCCPFTSSHGIGLGNLPILYGSYHFANQLLYVSLN